MRSAGVLLVFNFLVTPAVTGLVLGHNVRTLFGWVVVSGLLYALPGFALSIPFDLPTGPAIIAVSGGLAGAAWAVRALRGGRMKRVWLTFGLALALSGNQLPAQRLEARVGAMISSPLVKDLGPSASLAVRIPAEYRSPVTVKLLPAPIVSVGVVHDLSTRTGLELMGSVAVTKLRAETQENEWDTQDVSLAALALTVRYQYWQRIALHGGLGITRFFSESTGIFSEGSDLLPLLELGASATIPLGALPIRAGARLQTHTFGTPALQRDGVTDGRIIRLLLQVGIGG
jgi:hypothetical protein